MRGIIYVAYGEAARQEARLSMQGLSYPVTVVGDRPIEEAGHIPFPNPGYGARWAKLNVDLLSPYNPTGYIDADTRVYQPLDAGFEIIEDGWDFAIAPSMMQGEDWLWKCGEERERVIEECFFQPLSLQAGVFFFAKNERTGTFFQVWREMWQGKQDQAALLRALYRVPIKVWLLGRPWNGGTIIQHRFGFARA